MIIFSFWCNLNLLRKKNIKIYIKIFKSIISQMKVRVKFGKCCRMGSCVKTDNLERIVNMSSILYCNARRFTYVTNTRINIYEVDSIKNLSIIFELMQHLAPADKSNCPSTTFMSIYTFSLIERISIISIGSVWDSMRLYETR